MTISRLTAVAARQHGAISTEQLASLGVDANGRRRAGQRGWLRRVAPGVYVVAGSADTIERKLAVGLLQLGVGAVVSHEAAARLHGFDRCRSSAVEFTVDRARRSGGRGLIVHSTKELATLDRVRVAGFPCTSATRTIIDLARLRIDSVRLEAAIDSAVRLGLSSPIVLARRLDELRGRGRWGAPRIDRLLVDSGGHTFLERRFLELVRRAGLPRPATQVVHRRNGRTFARVDFLFAEHGLVVEVSGRRGHASDAERAKDAQRRNELTAAGLRFLEFTTAQVLHEPGMVTRTVRALTADAVPRSN